jgi:hypothetical protein
VKNIILRYGDGAAYSDLTCLVAEGDNITHFSMEWVRAKDWSSMPDHPCAEDSGWIRVSPDSAFAELFCASIPLARDPSRAHGFIVRMTNALAWALHFVHFPPASDRGYSVQRFTLTPTFLESVAHAAVRAGITASDVTSRHALRHLGATVIAADPAAVSPKRRDWVEAIEYSIAAPWHWSHWLDWEAAVGEADRPLALADLFNYIGNFITLKSRKMGTNTMDILDFLLDSLVEHDRALSSLASRHKATRLLEVLGTSPAPAFLPSDTKTLGQTFANISARVDWNFGDENVRERVALANLPNILVSGKFANINALLRGSMEVDWPGLLKRGARLLGLGLDEKWSLRLSSLGAFQRLEEYLRDSRGVYQRESLRRSSAQDRIQALEVAKSGVEAALKGGSSNAGDAGKFSREAMTLIAKELRDPDVAAFEDEVMDLLRKSPRDDFEIFDKVTAGRKQLHLKLLLGYMKTLPLSSVSSGIASTRGRWGQWATLVLVTGVQGWRVADDRSLAFSLPQGVLDQVLKDASKVNLFSDIWAPYARQVLHHDVAVDVSLMEVLLDAEKRQQVRAIGDRMCWLLGFKSVEEAGSVPDSFAAVVDQVGKFIAQGAALSGIRRQRHLALASTVMEKARSESQAVHRQWADSSDPRHELPATWVPQNSVCKSMLKAQQGRLEKLLDIVDYAPEILSGEPAPAPLAEPRWYLSHRGESVLTQQTLVYSVTFSSGIYSRRVC